MTIEQEVVSYELSKDITAVGLKLPSVFKWNRQGKVAKSSDVKDLHAYLAAELLNLLPFGIKVKIEGMRKCYDGRLQIRWRPATGETPTNQFWSLDYDRFQADLNVEAHTLPDAVAKMFLLLVEKKLIYYPITNQHKSDLWAERKLQS